MIFRYSALVPLLANVLMLLPADAALNAPEAESGRDWYVSPNGKATNSGTRTSPWDLSTALSGKRVHPGDTIWLREGKYVGVFNSYLSGTRGAPITVRQFPGERATISDTRQMAAAATLNVFGAWTIYRDFEVTNSDENRGELVCREHTCTNPISFRPMGIEIQAPNTKFINLVIHDTGFGFGFWQQAVDSELYGNIIYYCGTPNSPSNLFHGHTIYTQNSEGTKTIRDNIGFDQFGWGINVYPDPGNLRGYYIQGNILSNNGMLSNLGTRYNNILVSGYPPFSAERITLADNYTYDSSSQLPTNNDGTPLRFSDANVCLGCSDRTEHKDIVVTNNYFAGGIPVVSMMGWKDVTFTGNTLVGRGGMVALGSLRNSDPRHYLWDKNNYLGSGFGSDNALFGVNGKVVDFSTWQRLTGFDHSGHYTAGRPTGVKIFVRPNEYESGRANIVVYNWDLRQTVNVDVSEVLKVGAHYEVRNVQDYFGLPILSGTYEGHGLALLLTGLNVAAPMGWDHAPQPTGPEFNVFVLLSTGKHGHGEKRENDDKDKHRRHHNHDRE